jgi:hypothetical protein
MYYSKEDGTDGDYYNTYKGNSYQYENGKDYLTLILKILLIILLIGLLFFGYLFFENKTRLDSTGFNMMGQITKFDISENKAQKENREDGVKKMNGGLSSMSQEDIAVVVQLVISKMNKKLNSSVVDDDKYRKELSSQDVDELDELLKDIDITKLNPKEIAKNSSIPKNINYYNKIVINQREDERYNNDRLSQLSNKLSSFTDDDIWDANSSSYTKAIIKELRVRSNEMRVVVVKKGDTLSKIAKRAYGNYKAYRQIFKANPEVIKNPNQIFVGQRLRIPN